jgi:hypothetical protein
MPKFVVDVTIEMVGLVEVEAGNAEEARDRVLHGDEMVNVTDLDMARTIVNNVEAA